LGNRLKVLEDALELVAYLNDKQVRRYRDVAFADGAHGKAARVELLLQGGAWATREEVEEERRVRAERARKRRQTLAKNRAAKLLGRVRLAPALRLPTRRDSP
jgi:crossover junction endodeoxyribonuclease RusA